MKIDINQSQSLSQTKDTTLKRSKDNQELGFEDIILQMMSMTDIKTPQNLEMLEFDGEKTPQHETIDSQEEETNQGLKTQNKASHTILQDQVFSKETIIQDHHLNRARLNIKTNDEEEVQGNKNIKNIVEDIKLELEKNPRNEVEIKSNLDGKERELITEKRYNEENYQLLKNKIVAGAPETIPDSSEGQEENTQPMKVESYKGQEIDMPFNEKEVEKDKQKDSKILIENEKPHKTTENNKDISREKLNTKDFSSDLQAAGATQTQYIEKVEMKPERTEIKNLRDITHEMVKEIKLLKEGETSSLNLKLKPKELGEIEIKLEIKTGQVVGKILVDSIAVKGALESQMQNLKDNLSTQDVILKDIEITVQQNNQEQNQHQERENNFFDQKKKSSNKFLAEEIDEQIADTAVYYQHSLSNSYYSSQKSSLNLLA